MGQSVAAVSHYDGSWIDQNPRGPMLERPDLYGLSLSDTACSKPAQSIPPLHARFFFLLLLLIFNFIFIICLLLKINFYSIILCNYLLEFVHKLETLANHVIELGCPWMFMIPIPIFGRPLRIVGGIIQILFQVEIRFGEFCCI